MNRSNVLALVTTRFPFGYGETFLETEIQFLSDKFDKILIFPEIITDRERSLPSNVFIDKSYSKLCSKRFSRICNTLFSLYFYKMLWSERTRIKSFNDLVWVFRFCSNQTVWNLMCLKNQPVLNEIDIFYTYWFTASSTSLLRLRKNRRLNAKIVSRVHRYDVYESEPDSPSFWPAREYTLKNIDKVFTISENARNYLLRKFGGVGDINVSRLGVIDKGKTAKNSDIGYFAIVSVSRMAPMKRVDFIFSCVLEFAKKNPSINVLWTHFGGGELLCKLREEIRIKVIPNLKVDLRGIVKNVEIYKHYATQAVDVFVNLSTSEGIPVSIMEAQSFGIPVVATNVGGNAEIVLPQTGFVVKDIDSHSEVTKLLSTVYSKRYDHSHIKEIWREMYDANKNYLRFAEELKSVIENDVPL